MGLKPYKFDPKKTGASGAIASLLAYSTEKQFLKNPEKLGKGTL